MLPLTCRRLLQNPPKLCQGICRLVLDRFALIKIQKKLNISSVFKNILREILSQEKNSNSDLNSS